MNREKYDVRKLEVTISYSRNQDVSTDNIEKLEKIPEKLVKYEAVDTKTLECDQDGIPVCKNIAKAKIALQNNNFYETSIATKELELKIGAQVMLIRNDPSPEGRLQGKTSLVNGSRGVVIGFTRRMPKNETLSRMILTPKL